MTSERIVRIVAGSFVLLSLSLGAEASPAFVSPAFLWLAAFVGVNLAQSGFTRFCPLEIVLRRRLHDDAGSRARGRSSSAGAG
jgi:hypothetical protein